LYFSKDDFNGSGDQEADPAPALKTIERDGGEEEGMTLDAAPPRSGGELLSQWRGYANRVGESTIGLSVSKSQIKY
jgi:hypothetical protein